MSVCEHSSLGVKVYSLAGKDWKPLFNGVICRVQLFQNGKLLLRAEHEDDFEVHLKSGSTIKRYEKHTHLNCCEMQHQNMLYLLKFQQPPECAQFVVKSERFLKSPSQDMPHPAPRQNAWEEIDEAMTLPQALNKPRPAERRAKNTNQTDFYPRRPPSRDLSPGRMDHGEPLPVYHRQTPNLPNLPNPQPAPKPAAQGLVTYDYRPPGGGEAQGSPMEIRYPPSQPKPSPHQSDTADYISPLSSHALPNRQGMLSASRSTDVEVEKALRENMSPEDMDFWVVELAKAINNSNPSEASKVVHKLIEYTDVVGSVDLKCKCIEDKGKQDLKRNIRLNVTVHSQNVTSDTGNNIIVQADRQWKVLDLKIKVEQQCLLPRQVQRWIFGKTLVKDSDVIGDLVGDVDHFRPFMYVVKAKKVNLDRLIYQNYKERMGDQQREQEENRVSEPTNAMSYQSSVPRSEYLYTDTGPAYAPSTVHSAPTHGRDVHCSDSRAQKDSPLQAQSRPKDQSSMANRPPQVASPDSWGSQPVRPMYSEEPEFEEDRPTAHQTHRPVDVEPAHPPIYGLDIPINSPPPIKEEGLGWECPNCTFLNKPLRPGCEMCTADRPDSYRIPENYHPDETEKQLMMKIQEDHQAAEATRKEQQEAKKKTWEDLLATDFKDYIENQDDFECPTCLTDYGPGEGIVLRNCLHTVCKDCFKGICINSEEAQVACPYADADYQCDGFVTEREMRGLLTEEEFLKIEEKGLSKAEGALPNTFHCRTADCKGWCQYEDEVNEFACVLCKSVNCLVCKAIHQGMNCKEYQDDINRLAANDEAARATKDFMERMVAEGQAMLCPSCGVVVQKKEGCDWIRCSVCKTELCWATKGRRWGPKGKGDITGGCKCNIPRGQKCHPQCGNCH